MDRYKGISLTNTCECLVDENELTRAILWYSNNRLSSTKKIFMYGNYPAVSIAKEKLHVHRLLMMYWEQRKLSPKEYVHHIDENKLNAQKNNLKILYVSDHQSHHNKGKSISDNHRRLISEANRKRKGLKHRKRVDIPINELKHLLASGNSINSIAKRYKCDWTTIKARIIDNPELLEG